MNTIVPQVNVQNLRENDDSGEGVHTNTIGTFVCNERFAPREMTPPELADCTGHCLTI